MLCVARPTHSEHQWKSVSCQEKNYLLKYYLKKGVKHCYCVRKSQREATLFPHLWASMPRYTTYKCGEMDLNFFFLATLLFIVLSVDFLEEVRLIKPCCEKIYYLHVNGTKVQNNYYKSIHAVLSALHMIAMARSFYPCWGLGVYPKENIFPGDSF